MSDILKQPTHKNIKISEAVIESIAKEAALEVDGVVKLLPLPLNMKDYLFKAKKPKPFKIELRQGTVCISVGVAIQCGKSIPRLAKGVQEGVKASIQEMTGLVISRIDVFVMGLV